MDANPAQQLITVTLAQRLVFGAAALVLMSFVVMLIQRRQMDLRHAFAWFPIGAALFIFSLFPQALGWISHALGFQLASNAAMSMAIMGLIFLVLVQSVALSRAKKDIRDLAQRLALLEERQSSRAR